MTIDHYVRPVYSALLKDLNDVEERKYRPHPAEKEPPLIKRRPHEHEIEVYSFPQTWGSTALGFGGIGGSAMTTALTVVVMCGREACVYFGGSFAYRIKDANDRFFEDMRSHNMSEVHGAVKAYSREVKSG